MNKCSIICENFYSNVINYAKAHPLRSFMEFLIISLIQFIIVIPIFLYATDLKINSDDIRMFIAGGLSYFGLSHAALDFKKSEKLGSPRLMEMKLNDFLLKYFTHLLISIFGVLLPLMWLGSSIGMTVMVGGIFYVAYLMLFK